jgi:predicted nucleic acid-binding Zn ribbon protein
MKDLIDEHMNTYNGSSNSRQPDLTRYNYMCDECGEAFHSLDEYIEHFKLYHPRSIGTAIT